MTIADWTIQIQALWKVQRLVFEFFCIFLNAGGQWDYMGNQMIETQQEIIPVRTQFDRR